MPPARNQTQRVARPALRTQVVIEARVAEDGRVASAVWLGGSLLCQRQEPLPAEVTGVWGPLAGTRG